MPSDTINPDGPDTLIRSVADTMADVTRTVTRIGQDVALTVSRATYSGAYFISYGIVFSTLFVVNVLPRENPVMKGLQDGGRAARDARTERAA